jgi:hypothetical protein
MNIAEIKIEKGIPMPESNKRRWNTRDEWESLLLSMEIGDSAVIPYIKLSYVYAVCRGVGVRLRVQAQEWKDGEEFRMIRIWRLE